MGYGDHKVPTPLKDEDKWYKFTKRQWAIVLPAVVLAIIILRVTKGLNILPVGVALVIVMGILAWCLAFWELPPEKYLFGSGEKMEKLAFRLWKKKLPKNRKIYTKNYENGYKEWRKKL